MRLPQSQPALLTFARRSSKGDTAVQVRGGWGAADSAFSESRQASNRSITTLASLPRQGTRPSLIHRGWGKFARSSGALTDFQAILILLALTSVTIWGHFGIRNRLNDLDTLTFYIPWYGFMGERLRAFDVPGWMPYQFSGTAFAADPQSGWMYLPAMFFFTVLPATTAHTAFLVFHWLLAGLSMFALARLLGMRQTGALVAAVALEFGTFIQLTHINLLRSQLGAWLPLTLMGIELSLKARSWSGKTLGWAVTGFAISQVLAAWIGQGAYLALLIAGSYLAFRTIVTPPSSITAWRDRTIHLTVGGGAILAIAFGLNAAALIPRLEWNKRTNLAGGDYSDLYSVGGRGWSFARIIDRTTSYESSLLYWYIGVMVVTLAIIGVFLAGRRFATPYFAVLSLTVVLLALDDGPLHQVFYLLPKFETFHQHQPNRTLVVLSLSVPLMAGAAVDRMPEWTRHRLALLAPLLPMGVYGLIAVTLPDELDAIGSPTLNAIVVTVLVLMLAALLGQREIREGRLWTSPAGLTIAIAILVLIWWDPTGSVIVRPLPIDPPGHISEHLVNKYGATSDPGGPGEFLQLQRDTQPPFRYFGMDAIHWEKEKSSSRWAYHNRYEEASVIEIIPPPLAIRLELEDVQGYNPIHIRRYDEYFQAMNGQSQNYHVSEVLRGGVSSLLLDLLNVRFIVVPNGQRGDWDGAELLEIGVADRQVFANDRVRVLENLSAFPRAWIVHKATTVDPGEALPVLASASFDPLATAVIERTTPELSEPAAGANEWVTVQPADSPDRIRLTAQLDAPGLVVLSEIYDPGWNAYVDGEQVPVFVTNHTFRSVPVPAGNHTIELRFEPASVDVGLAISGLTIVAIAAVAVFVLRRRRAVSAYEVA